MIKSQALLFDMAPTHIRNQIEELILEQAEPHQDLRVEKSREDLLGKLGHEVFKYDCLDRQLKRHHVTGNCPLNFCRLLAHVRKELLSRVLLALVSFRLQGRS